MTPRSRKYFRRRIQRKYFALTAVTTFMGAMQLEMIRQQPLPLPNYIRGGVTKGGIAMVGEGGGEVVMPTKESTEILRAKRSLDIAQSITNTAFAIKDILTDMKRKTDKI